MTDTLMNRLTWQEYQHPTQCHESVILMPLVRREEHR